MQFNNLLDLVIHILNEMKAQDIANLDVRHLTSVTDHMIVCSATSSRQAKAIADKLVTECKQQGFKPLGMEGQDSNEWILVDLGDIIVHIMLAQTREFYNLEKLWAMTEKKKQASHGEN
ncbi:MAG: ribosome silencing factor [Gammaproteobacteria bacterium]